MLDFFEEVEEGPFDPGRLVLDSEICLSVFFVPVFLSVGAVTVTLKLEVGFVFSLEELLEMLGLLLGIVGDWIVWG